MCAPGPLGGRARLTCSPRRRRRSFSSALRTCPGWRRRSRIHVCVRPTCRSRPWQRSRQSRHRSQPGAIDIQESSHYHLLHTVGAELYDDVLAMEDVDEMPRIALRLRHLFSRRQGAVVELSVPTNLLSRTCPPLPDLGAIEIGQPAPSARTLARVTRLLSGPGGPPAFLFGSGAVAYRDRLGALVKRWDAVDFSTPAATAVLPGSLGVVGNAAHGDVPRRLRELDVRCVVVLGSRLGTASGGGDDALLPPGCHIVHVDVDPAVVAGNAVATRGHRVTFVLSDIGEFLDALATTSRSD